MKCPRCGAAISDETLYCPKCGEEIKFVPEFDPLVESKIDESLSSLADDLGKTREFTPYRDGPADEYDEDQEAEEDFDANEEAHLLNSPKAVITVLCIGLAALIACVIAFFAARSGSSDEDVVTRNADNTVAESASTAATIDPNVPETPVLSVKSGTYDTEISVDVEAGEGSVYYTINGDAPTSSDQVYNGIDPIIFAANGTYVLQVVLIDKDGVSSQTASATYEIAMPVPDDPTILEDSGSYTVDTDIVAVARDGVSIYYTTDGSDPTAASAKYTSPIAMPYGDSMYKFIAVDDATGYESNVVTKKYSLHYTVNITEEQAVSSLISELVAKGYLLDGNGTVAGMDGYHLYTISGTQVIDDGDYYVIVENHVSPDGSTVQTGLLYAVNVHDGSVYRLGTDTAGNYFLKQFS